MPRHRSYRATGGHEAMASEWSSSQLVIGIVVAIVFGSVCFGFGYVIARYDPPLDDRSVPVATAAPVQKPGTAAPANVTPKGSARVEKPPVQGAAAPKPAESVQRSGLRPMEIEPLPSPGKPTPVVRTVIPHTGAPDIKPPATEALPADAKPAVTPEVKPAAPGTPPAAAPPVTVASSTSPAVTKPPITPPAPKPVVTTATPETPPSKPPTVTRGSYGIQVAAFNGSKRKDQAEDSRKHLKSSTGKDAEIIQSSDGAYWKVVITGFPTRDAAKKECEALKTKTGYAEAWVVRLP